MPETSDPTRSFGGMSLAGTALADRYVLVRHLASGGMAQVWEATDRVLGRRVAVKLLHPHLAADESFVARFRREAIAAAGLAHPGIVSIFDTCSERGLEAIVMELVEGITLREHLDRGGPMTPADAAEMAAQVAEALAVAHRAGIVHRDVKPANVLLCDDRRTKVADFGIAKALESSDATKVGTMLGTAKYLAPEQVDGDTIDARADVYALGVVLYEALCGRPPFDAETDVATALARLQRPPARPRQLRAGIPRALEGVVLRALERDPAARFASADEMATALRALRLEQTPSAPMPPPLPPAEPRASIARSERRWFIPTLAIVLAAVAIGVAGLLLGRTDTGQDLFERAIDVVRRDEPDPPPALPQPVVIAGVATMDPEGDGVERDDIVERVIDGQVETVWQTEGYATDDFGGLSKSGVGLVLTLAAEHQLAELIVTSPSDQWSAEVYVADADESTDGDGPGSAWGQPVATRDPVSAGRTVFDLGGASGRRVLLWITRLSSDPQPVRVVIAEVSLTA